MLFADKNPDTTSAASVKTMTMLRDVMIVATVIVAACCSN